MAVRRTSSPSPPPRPRDRGDSVGGGSTRQRLIEEAERLFAVRGFAGVSLREIGAAAGARNNSAAQYHFGDRQGLVDAVFDHRMAPINERRLTLLAVLDARDDAGGGTVAGGAAVRAARRAGGEVGADTTRDGGHGLGDEIGRAGRAGADGPGVATGRAGDAAGRAGDAGGGGDRLRQLVAAMVVPLADAYDPEPQSTYYARFSSQVMADPALVRSVASLERPVQAGLREVYMRIAKMLAASTSLPEPVIDQRLRLASTLFVRALADYEADRDAGMPIPALPFPQFVDGLVDAITALLLAPHTGTCRSWRPVGSVTATSSDEGGGPARSSRPSRPSRPSHPSRPSKELP